VDVHVDVPQELITFTDSTKAIKVKLRAGNTPTWTPKICTTESATLRHFECISILVAKLIAKG